MVGAPRPYRAGVPLYADDVWGEPAPTRRMIWRALRRRCPRCGHRPLFRRWVRIVPRCPGCGYPFEREEGSFLGGYVVNLGVTLASLLVVFAWVVLGQSAHPGSSVTAQLVVGVAVGGGVPLVFYPYSRLLWAAIELATMPLEMREILAASEAVDDDTPENEGDGPLP